MDLAAIVRDMRVAARPEEPVAQELLSPVQWRPAALQQARVILAARRPTVHVADPHWCNCPARRRADLKDQSCGHDAYEYPVDAQQATQQERKEKADANWRRALAQQQSWHSTLKS